MKRNSIVYGILMFLIVTGFWFRIQGILDNHSFWADEAGASKFAKDIVIGKSSILSGMMAITYEPLHIGITALFFFLIGFSEFAARLPYVLFGTVGIVFAYLLAKKLSNNAGGLLAAFIYSFSQLNLAKATQAKPYAAIETLLLIVLYLIICIDNRQRTSSTSPLFTHLLIISLLLAATLMHTIASMFWIIYVVYCSITYAKQLPKLLTKPNFVLLLIMLEVIFFYIVSANKVFFSIQNEGKIFLSDNTMYIKNLLLKQYGIFLLSALCGLYYSYKQYKNFTIGLVIWGIVLLGMWNYRSYSHNIRYLVPFFGVLYVYVGVAWGNIGKYISHKLNIKSLSWIPLFIAVMLYISGYKVVRFPQSYYTPNADFYGDVQIADYKTMFSLIKKEIPDYKNIALYNDVPDAELWYMPSRRSNAYFMKGTIKPFLHPFYRVMIYGDLNSFLIEKSKHQKGILIVEDWESYLPEDIKQYAKKNMKLEFRVEGLAQAKNDPWPLEVYSWGMR